MKTKKHVVITGASKGLGHAMVGEFIDRGYTVSTCARNKQAMQELQQAHAVGDHHFDVVDLATAAEVESWCQQILQRSGPPQLLINNASIINPNAPLWEISADEFSQLIDINIKAVFLTIKHLLPAMLLANEGIIVNLSSGWGRSVSADVAPYCASKWAIEGLTKALAAELPQGRGKKFAAVPLNPGIINTGLLQSCFGDSANAYGSAETWAKSAVPFILEIDSKDNGSSLTAPG